MTLKMKVTSDVEVDLSGLKKFVKQIKNKSVDVGYIDSPIHWSSKTHALTVADVARQLHYWSPWGQFNINGSFMLDERSMPLIQSKVTYYLETGLGKIEFKNILNNLGADLRDQMKYKIMSADTPPNDEAWAKEKGFNAPLKYGSEIGKPNNLLSEVKYKVRLS